MLFRLRNLYKLFYSIAKTNFIFEVEFLNTKEEVSAFKKKVSEYIKVLSKEEGLNCSVISFLFCDDKRIKEFNRKYLSHNYETDILTFFDTDDSPKAKGKIESDIIISVDTVKQNSRRFKRNFSEELFRVILHGLLHLCGYNDENTKDKSIMRRMEDHYLEKVGYYSINA